MEYKMEPDKLNILLIEDNPSDNRIIEEYLKKSEKLNFDLESCIKLREGLNLMEIKKFDVLLLDLSLPDSDRENTLKYLKEITKKTPIIVLTGFDDSNLALEAIKKGAEDYISKNDLNSPTLTRAILYAIERHKTKNIKEKIVAQTEYLDEYDKKILNLMQEDCRISYSKLHKKVNLAASTIHSRVQNMIKKGIIKKFNAMVDPFKVGYESVAIIGMSVDPSKIDEIAKKIALYDEVQFLATSTGDHNIIVKIVKKDDTDLWTFINEKIKTIDGVSPRLDISRFIEVFKMDPKINL
ncbi:MAG: response regulator [Promethearchaeota archaeon]|nr:MAG: response regulator [Candidatus Lokiarchaeota archaeon]